MVTIRYFAAAQAAAQTESDEAIPGTVNELIAAMGDAHGTELAKVLAASSFLIDGVAVRDFEQSVPRGSTLDVLPPFAGG